MSYRAVLFDLFDTLVLFERSRLPEIHVNGKTLRSTAGHLHTEFLRWVPEVDLGDFVNALFWSWQEAERIRNDTYREVAAPERFAMMFARLGVASGRLGPEAVQALLDTHKRELSRAAVFPAHHAGLLRALGGRYRLAVVSNFDYTPTARHILEREGVAGLFDAVVVSDEIGWRKPKPVIFETALARLGIGAHEALFVGDRADIDVAGAQGVGMGAAWINREGAELPPDVLPPDYEIRDLKELAGILGI